MERRLGCAVLAFALAACSGTSNGSIPNAALQNNVHTQKIASAEIEARRHGKKVRVKVRIHVPNHKKFRNPRVRHRMTVSENTKGIQIIAYAAGDRSTPLGTVDYNISPTSSNCVAGVNDARTCTLSLDAPAGNTDFVATTWDVAPPNGGNFPAGNQLGYGVDPNVNVVTGVSPPTINFSLNSVLAQVGVAVTPSSLHTIIPSSATVSVYGLDADSDVILTSQYIRANGSSASISLSIDNTLGGKLSLATSSLSSSSPNGVALTYAGMFQGPGSTPVTITANGVGTSATAALNAIDPTFTTIGDPNLMLTNTHLGGMVFDTSGGVFYTTVPGSGGISYYSGSGATVTNHYAGTLSQPIIGGSIASSGSGLFAIGGTVAATFSAPPSATYAPLPSQSAAPVPNGSAMAYDSTNNALWYTSGTQLAEFVFGNAPAAFPLGVTTESGVAVDTLPAHDVWVVDNANNQLFEESGGSVSAPFSLAIGGSPFDILANANGLFITDHGSTPAILKVNPNNPGNPPEQILIPHNAVPWYLLADNAQPGIVWFDYLINGNQIGLARMDTNVDPPVFTMATDKNGPTGPQPGAIGAASDGTVYMVFETVQKLVKVVR